MWGWGKAMKKIKTIYPGVRYREHETRRYSGKPDRYFFIRYRLNGTLKEEGVGWVSEGWNGKKVSMVLSQLKEAHVSGAGPHTLKERRLLRQEKLEAEEAEKKRQAMEEISFGTVFLEQYSHHEEGNKGAKSFRREQDLYKLWIGPVIGELPLKGIGSFHLERLKKKMADAGAAPRSIRYALAVIRQVFNFAKRNDLYYGESPTAKVKMPQSDNRRLRFLSHEEAGILFETLRKKSDQLHEISTFSLHCGLRAGEIFSLTWGDVDTDRGMMTLRDTKSGKNRTAFMTDEVKQILLQKQRGGNDDFVFTDQRHGGQIKEVSNSFQKIVKELGFNDGVTDPRQRVVFHTLRHTYASWLVESGVDLYTVKELLGHSTIALTERYSHLGNDTLQRAVKMLEQGMKKTKGAKRKKTKSEKS
jgi:integrase